MSKSQHVSFWHAHDEQCARTKRKFEYMSPSFYQYICLQGLPLTPNWVVVNILVETTGSIKIKTKIRLFWHGVVKIPVHRTLGLSSLNVGRGWWSSYQVMMFFFIFFCPCNMFSVYLIHLLFTNMLKSTVLSEKK